MKPVFIVLISFFSATILVLAFILLLVFKPIKRSTKLKARQYSLYRDYTEKGGIVFLGDSLTEFFRIEEFFHAHNPYNRGIAADTSADVLERLQTNVIDLKPRKVFLQIGTNDLNSIKKNRKETTVANIKTILTKLRENLPEAEIFFISLYPVNRKAKFFSPFFVGKRKNEDIVVINSEIKSFCKQNSFLYIDVYSHLLDEKGNLDANYTFEGLHLNFEGYRKIAEILKPHL